MGPVFPRVYGSMDSPVIQLRFKGRVVQTLSFQGDVLRIGRMRENDIVISNASVSRFHAVLKRENGQVILEDSGSENGCYVNGTRISGRIALTPGDEVQIGKHQLVLSDEGEEEPLPSEVIRPGKSDAWDASNTYFVDPDAQAKMLRGSRSEPPATDEDERDSLLPVAPETAAEQEAPPQQAEPLADDVEVESSAGKEAASDPIEVAVEEAGKCIPDSGDVAEESEAAESLAPPDPEESRDESPFAFGIDADLVNPEPGGKMEVNPEDYDVEPTDVEPEERGDEAVEPEEPSSPEPEPLEQPVWYAGLIIQNQGKLERILSWDRDRLTAGRSAECEIHLDQPEVSRRHAMFVREQQRYEVRDLESINGILVNGEKVGRRDLEVGDVVKIEGFELTFLLDRQPIASEIVTDDLATPREAAAEERFDMTMIDERLPIGAAGADPSTASRPPEPLDEQAEMPEESLFGSEDDEKEELVEVEALSPSEAESSVPAEPKGTEEVVTLELRVRLEDLPLPLRAALAEVDGADLTLPVELVLKTATGGQAES